jgi:hypothetical protein
VLPARTTEAESTPDTPRDKEGRLFKVTELGKGMTAPPLPCDTLEKKGTGANEREVPLCVGGEALWLFCC